MSTGIEVPKALDAIPVVQSTTDRNTRFPTPNDDQRVFNKTTGNVERWSVAANAWVTDSHGANTFVLFNVQAPKYGAVGDGVANDTAAIALALADAQGVNGGALYFPPGQYLTDEITVTADGTAVLTSGIGTVLKARADNQVVLRIAASNCVVDDMTIDGNGHANVDGLALAPANESDHTTKRNQNYNRIGHLYIGSCANGVRLRAGPGTTSGDSGCFYNTFLGVHVYACTRGIWLQAPVSNAGGGATSGAPPNRNTFFGVRCGQAPMNTGVQIDAGDTNTFFALSTEGVSTGTSPNTTPTGLVIAATDAVTGADNNNNRFYGYTAEANTRDIDNGNTTTQFYGPVVTAAKCAGAHPFGGLCLPADASTAPLLLPGLQYGEGVAGFPSGRWGMTTPVTTPASATGNSGLRVTPGVAPTSPADGDVWTTSAGLFVRINGVTKTVTLT